MQCDHPYARIANAVAALYEEISMNTQKILLIENDSSINAANRNALELEGYVVYAARTIKTGRRLCEKYHPDLVLLDAILPDGSSLDFVRDIKNRCGANIFFLSGLSTKSDVIRGLKAGGDDYMTKPYLMEELLLRVASLLRMRHASIALDDFTTGRLRWHVAAKQIDLDGDLLHLQPKEYAVLEYLQRSSSGFISSKELAEKIWLTEDESAVRASIHNTIHNLRQKLEGTDCIILHRRDAGYKFNIERKQDGI